MSILEKTLQQERYRINLEFGSVGNAKIYRAYDSILKTQVVLKEVSQKPLKETGQLIVKRSSFINEAKILTGIKHESLPVVHDYFSETDNHYLVLELIDGLDLAVLLENNKKPFTVAQVTKWADQLFGALDYLHRQSPPIIHLAVKPQNIKLTGEGRIRLHTFGDSDISAEQVNEAFMNQTAEVSDLPYLPIEQIWKGLDSASQNVILGSYDEKSEAILEQPPDARADIYSLGATLYYLLTGILPADALTRSIDLLEGKTDPLIPPHQINLSVPATISQLIMRAMEIRRENRFDSSAILRQVWRSTNARIAETEAQNQARKAEAAAQAAKLANRKQIEAAQQLAEDQRLQAEIEHKRLAEAQLKAERERANAEREKAQSEFARQRQAEETARQKILVQERQNAIETAIDTRRSEFPADTKISQNYAEPEDAAAQIGTPKIEISPETDDDKTESLQASKVLTTSSQVNDAKMDQMFLKEKSSAKNDQATAPNQSGADFDNLFAGQSEKGGGSSRQMAAIAGIFAVLCCAAAGIWFLLSAPKTRLEPSEAVPAMTLSEPLKPAQTIENNAPANVEETPVPAPAQSKEAIPNASDSPHNGGKRLVSNPGIPAAAPRAAKASEPMPAKPTAAKPTAAPKKSVTADDLINDN